MKINKDFVYKHVLDSDILVDTSGKLNGVIKLNKTSAYIYEGLVANKDIEELINELLAKYDVKEEDLRKDVLEFINKMKEIGAFSD